MKKSHIPMFFVAALAAPFAGSAYAASVHSAAGVVPPLPGTHSSEIDWNRGSRRPTESALTTPSTPPPLPRTAMQPAPNASPTMAALNHPAKMPKHTAAPRQEAQPTPQKRNIGTGFDDVLAQTVTIDVVDMRLEDLLEQLAPNGWRLRVQNVDQAILDQRVDLTAQSSRGAVLHELLGQSSLTIKPFDGFDVPLLLITIR